MAGGKLLLIGTPIGNLGDLSPRALEAIRACSLLLCEMRFATTGQLWSHSTACRIQAT